MVDSIEKEKSEKKPQTKEKIPRQRQRHGVVVPLALFASLPRLCLSGSGDCDVVLVLSVPSLLWLAAWLGSVWLLILARLLYMRTVPFSLLSLSLSLSLSYCALSRCGSVLTSHDLLRRLPPLVCPQRSFVPPGSHGIHASAFAFFNWLGLGVTQSVSFCAALLRCVRSPLALAPPVAVLAQTYIRQAQGDLCYLN